MRTAQRQPTQRLLTIILITLALVATACGGGDSSDGAGAGIADSINAVTDPTATPEPLVLADREENCGPQMVEDEYGFMVEITVCDSDSVASTAQDEVVNDLTPAEAIAAVPDPVIQGELQAAHAALLGAASQCADQAAWAAQTQTAATQVRDLTTRMQTAPGLEAWVGSGDAEQLSRAFRNALVVHPTCGGAGNWGEVSPAARQAMADAASANDGFRNVVTAQRRLQLASEYWFHSEQVGHAREIIRLQAAGPVELVAVGSSAMKRGFDANLASERLGVSAMNVSTPGLFSEALPQWWDLVEQMGIAPQTVVVGYGVFEEFSSCVNKTERMTSASTAVSQAFAGLGALDVAPILRLVGTNDTSYANTIIDGYATSYTSRGTTAGGNSAPADGVERQLPTYSDAISKAERCPARLAGYRQLLTDLQADGVRVVVVSLPLNPELIALNAGGRPVFQPVIDDYAAVAAEMGMTHLDFSDAVPAEGFLDLTHVIASYRTTLTEAILAELAS